MPRRRSSLAAAAALTAALAAPAAAPAAKPFPPVIPLPAGYQPEGIASGPGNQLYVGSIPTGAVTRVDARTGAQTVVVPAQEGRAAIGLKVDRGRIFVAGGPTGRAFVYDARTGATLADVVLTAAPTFVNDVTVTRDAAYFTDSQRQQLYRLPLGPGGAPAQTATTIPITGDLQYDQDPQTFEANGIAATPNGRTLFVVQSRTGKLFRVDPATGVSDEVELAGGDVAFGDGILLQGRTLYVVQNQLNRIAVVRLSADRSSGTIVRTIADADFQIPTTVARKGSRLYAVNAAFGTPPAEAPYAVVQVPAR